MFPWSQSVNPSSFFSGSAPDAGDGAFNEFQSVCLMTFYIILVWLAVIRAMHTYNLKKLKHLSLLQKEDVNG